MITENILFAKDRKFVVLDCETNGLNLTNGKPFQLSWIVASPFSVLEQRNEFIHFKDLGMSSEAAKVTRFDEEAYKSKARPPKEVYEEFAKVLFDKNNIIVGQNILNFDAYMIKNLQKECGVPVDYSWLSRCIDTKVLFIALQKNIKYGGNIPFLDWQYKVNSIFEKGLKSNQLFMLNYFDIAHDKERLHEALYDVLMLYEILKKLLMSFEVPNLQ